MRIKLLIPLLLAIIISIVGCGKSVALEDTTWVLEAYGEQGNLKDVLADTEGKISPLILDRVQLAESLSIKKVDGLVTVLPSEFRLHQNYPNPFNPETWIPYDLAADASVEITIYNTQGHRIRTLTLGAQPAGLYLTIDKAAHWDGCSDTGELVSSGIYFYHLRAGDFHATKKMIIKKYFYNMKHRMSIFTNRHIAVEI